LVESNGGKNGSGVTSKTDYLVAGENMGPAKLQKANELGLKILTEEEFLALIHFLPKP
jgi:DNA ligase (NAD+)